MRIRRILLSLNFLATVALLGVLCVMVNYLSVRRYARWDLTQGHLSALSDQTLQVLKTLPTPVRVILFYETQHHLYEMTKDLLKEYARISPKVKLEEVDPTQDPARAHQLVQEFEVDELNLVIFQSGTRKKVVNETALADYDYTAAGFGGQGRLSAFKGEEAFTSGLLSVTQVEQPLIWFSDGHGEKSSQESDPSGISDFQHQLEQQNMKAETQTLLEHSMVPAEVKLIVIAGPKRRFHETEVLLLQKYLELGGSCLFLLDPLSETGLENLLQNWGVQLGNDVVVDPSRRLPFVSAANLFVMEYAQHPSVKSMSALMSLFPLARSVQPSPSVTEATTVTPLAFTSAAGWGETQTSVETFQFTEGQDIKGPVSIAVAVERQASALSRLVVIGDSDFIMNGQLNNVGNKDFVLGTVHWLVNQEQLIGISPKPIESVKLNLTSSQLRNLSLFSVLAMPFLFGLSGVVMWWLRRR